ncbi:peptide-methionine (S)-S-oxide reductase MsrA [Deinococcus yavapaiensis]|uniref:Peptide methionine sulfoxide reductase MsrA n=1 Tax=Deinococcus yavapaiensis KR-236 TaxID=694435 RepID=A0A318SDV0_9DEIO|nr:peptide-methionine (S)-S-oxide reductase MsrA [Deinococcus yavapaiensis]PYE55231.1 peptide-methionine (S)-S-oxide reductase [Deinococcus yavapaiensis KR-236]
MMNLATLGGGCFWCTEAVFQQVRGVTRVTSGYSGGHVPRPTYEQVVTGRTGHAEVVQVEFDDEVISYRDLLMIFFGTHDPTTPDRQGADVGTQYRSVIFHHDERQRGEALDVIAKLDHEGVFGARLVTHVAPFEAFYEAEGYHQDFYKNNPNYGYCRAVVSPKVAKLRASFADKLVAVPTR